MIIEKPLPIACFDWWQHGITKAYDSALVYNSPTACHPLQLNRAHMLSHTSIITSDESDTIERKLNLCELFVEI
jgi:hypothetical protein